MNTGKTEYMCIEAEEGELQMENGKVIKACNEYKYLGVLFDKEGKDDRALNGAFCSRDISCTRKNIYTY